MGEIQIFGDTKELAQGAAQYFARCSAEAISSRGLFNVVLSGGNTPKIMFQILRCHPYDSQIDWKNTHIFWGDERDVGPDDPKSNYRMAHNSLLRRIPIPKNNINRILSEYGAKIAAARYEITLRDHFNGKLPRFDLIFLGMGVDGHTASLFPNTEALKKSKQWVVPNYIPPQKTWRVTMTATVINEARNIVFLINGENKIDRMRQVLQGPYQPNRLPSQLIKPINGKLIWMVDHPI